MVGPVTVGSGAVGRPWCSVGSSHLSDPDIVRLQLGSVALGRQSAAGRWTGVDPGWVVVEAYIRRAGRRVNIEVVANREILFAPPSHSAVFVVGR